MKKSMIVNDILAMGYDNCRGHVLLRQVEAKNNAQTNEATAAHEFCKPILLLEKWSSTQFTLIVVNGVRGRTAHLK
jgi:hypothetical protein